MDTIVFVLITAIHRRYYNILNLYTQTVQLKSLKLKTLD